MPVDRRDKTLEAEEMACGIFSIFVATGLQLRETFVLSLRTKFLLLPPETELGERNVRMSFGEADRVGERLRNVLPPWWSFVLPISNSPKYFSTSESEALPCSVDKRGVRECNSLSHQLAVDRQVLSQR